MDQDKPKTYTESILFKAASIPSHPAVPRLAKPSQPDQAERILLSAKVGSRVYVTRKFDGHHVIVDLSSCDKVAVTYPSGAPVRGYETIVDRNWFTPDAYKHKLVLRAEIVAYHRGEPLNYSQVTRVISTINACKSFGITHAHLEIRLQIIDILSVDGQNVGTLELGYASRRKIIGRALADGGKAERLKLEFNAAINIPHTQGSYSESSDSGSDSVPPPVISQTEILIEHDKRWLKPRDFYDSLLHTALARDWEGFVCYVCTGKTMQTFTKDYAGVPRHNQSFKVRSYVTGVVAVAKVNDVFWACVPSACGTKIIGKLDCHQYSGEHKIVAADAVTTGSILPVRIEALESTKRTFRATYISQAGTLTGIKRLVPGSNLQFDEFKCTHYSRVIYRQNAELDSAIRGLKLPRASPDLAKLVALNALPEPPKPIARVELEPEPKRAKVEPKVEPTPAQAKKETLDGKLVYIETADFGPTLLNMFLARLKASRAVRTLTKEKANITVRRQDFTSIDSFFAGFD
jgi:hypothetical protein